MAGNTLALRWKDEPKFVDRLRYAASQDRVIRLDASPFGTTEQGSEDFRGFSLSWVIKDAAFAPIQIEGAEICLSGSSSSGVSFHPVFERSQFSECDFDGSTLYEGSLDQCKFDRCSFDRAGVGHSHGKFGIAEKLKALFGKRQERMLISDCQFNSCSFKSTRFWHPFLHECVFNDCRIIGVDFQASILDKVRFEGLLKEVTFRGGPIGSLLPEAFDGVPHVVRRPRIDFSRATFGHAKGVRLL
jgi:uncharacterized protein YjbI with pentapeptide repeats